MVFDWLKVLHHFFGQTEVEPKPIITCPIGFSHAWHWVYVFALSSDWFIELFTTVVIFQSYFVWFRFLQHSHENHSKSKKHFIICFKKKNNYELYLRYNKKKGNNTRV